jgi:hypothetical protein
MKTPVCTNISCNDNTPDSCLWVSGLGNNMSSALENMSRIILEGFLCSSQSQILQLTTQCQNYMWTETTPQALTLKTETAVFAETFENLLRGILPKTEGIH